MRGSLAYFHRVFVAQLLWLLCFDTFQNLRTLEMSLGDCQLYYDSNDCSLWIGGDKLTSVEPQSELMGFGSGDFAEGATAKDVLSDPSGRWFRYSLQGPLADTNVIVECDRKLPDEVKGLPVWNKVGDVQKSMLEVSC